MYNPKVGSYHQFLNLYNECIGKGMQHEEIAYKLELPLMQYYELHSNVEAAELEHGRFVKCPDHLTKRDKAKKERIVEMTKLLNSP